MEIKEEPLNRKLLFNFHTCDSCSFRTKSLGVILSHIKKHQQKPELDRFSCQTANLELFECQFCYFKNGLKIALQRHASLTHGEFQQPDPEVEIKIYTCDKCYFETYSLLVFVRHVCDDSQLRAAIKNETNSKHRATKSNQSNSEKVKCIFKTKILARYTLMKNSSSNEVEWFKCEYCLFKAKSRNTLYKHTSRKHSIIEKVIWFKCKLCSYKTKVKNSLTQHTLSKHLSLEEVKLFECEHCSYRTKVKGNLMRHSLLRHSSRNEVKWFECEHCNYKTKVKGGLTKHILLEHLSPNEVQWFECEHCGLKTEFKHYNAKPTLLRQRLRRSIPNGLKWFECEHCKAFSRRTVHYTFELQKGEMVPV